MEKDNTQIHCIDEKVMGTVIMSMSDKEYDRYLTVKDMAKRLIANSVDIYEYKRYIKELEQRERSHQEKYAKLTQHFIDNMPL